VIAVKRDGELGAARLARQAGQEESASWVNIFETISKASRRLLEPIATQYLAELFREEPALVTAFWESVVEGDADWPTPEADTFNVRAEVGRADRRRIDLVITDDRRPQNSIGVEVKLYEDSVELGQLAAYATDPAKGSRLVFLTPFTRERFPDLANGSNAVKEFEAFKRNYPTGRHLSLLDLAELPVTVTDMHWPAFQAFVRGICTKRTFESRQGKPLWTFFPEPTVLAANEALEQGSIAVDVDGCINLREIADPDAIVTVLRIFANSAVASRRSQGKSTFTGNKQKFLSGPAGAIHEALFRFVDGCSCAKLRGSDDYAVVITLHGEGDVSLLQSDGLDKIILNHLPWAPEPILVQPDWPAEQTLTLIPRP
jgi:hypothetical protein